MSVSELPPEGVLEHQTTVQWSCIGTLSMWIHIWGIDLLLSGQDSICHRSSYCLVKVGQCQIDLLGNICSLVVASAWSSPECGFCVGLCWSCGFLGFLKYAKDFLYTSLLSSKTLYGTRVALSYGILFKSIWWHWTLLQLSIWSHG